MAETQERILDAACALVHEFRSWDWRPLTFRAVAEGAGVGERTVYRHFATEQALHAAVMQRLGQQSGVRYEGLKLDDVSKIGSKVFASISTFAAPTWVVVEDEGALQAEDERRRAALVAAVGESTPGWTDEQQVRAAAALDVLWGVPSYQRLATGWKMGGDEAAGVIDWMIDLVVGAIRDDRAGAPGRRRKPRKGS